MSDVKVGQVWKDLIGEPNEFMVEKVEDGWASGKRMKEDGQGKMIVVPGTSFTACVETMVLTKKLVR